MMIQSGTTSPAEVVDVVNGRVFFRGTYTECGQFMDGYRSVGDGTVITQDSGTRARKAVNNV